MNTEGMEQGSNHTLDNMAKLDLTRQYLKKEKKKRLLTSGKINSRLTCIERLEEKSTVCRRAN